MSKPKSPYPPIWFYILIFLESWIFPIPPDPFYIPQVLKYPEKTWHLAFQCTVISVLGGCVAYYLGSAFYDTFGRAFIAHYGCTEAFTTFAKTMKKWGALVIAVKGFTPFPYKIIALVAGMSHLSWPAFVLSSLVARAMRFYGIAFLTQRYGHPVTPVLKKYNFWLKIVWGILLVLGMMWIGSLCLKVWTSVRS